MSKRDILTQLAEDARRLRVARNLPEGKLPWEWIVRVQNDFKEFIERHGLSLSDVSRKMGRGYSSATLSGFCAMQSATDYIGDADRVVRGLNQFMETHARSLDVPRPAGWVETAVATRMITLIKNAVELRAIGTICSDAGRGKTMTLQAAKGIYQQAILIRVLRSTRTPAALARHIAKELRIKARTFYEAEAAIIDALKGSDRPILIDEAHQLTMDALEFLRDLHDVCDIPLILAGTKQISDKCNDDDQFFGQFSSRTALRYDVTEGLRHDAKPRPLHTVAEIKRIWTSDKVRIADDGLVLLAKLANLLGFGALRRCDRALHVASRLSDGKPIDAALILLCLRRLHTREDVERMESAMDDTRVKVA
jgi:DNA transposition AAA+ family ATPase